MPATFVFSLMALAFFVFAKFWLHSSLLWSLCFALTSAAGIIAALRAISRISSASAKLNDLRDKNASPAEVTKRLPDLLVSDEIDRAASLALILTVPIAMLCFKYIPWRAGSFGGQLIRLIAYLMFGMVPAVLLDGWVKRTKKKLLHAVESDATLSATWHSYETIKTEELIQQLMAAEKPEKQLAIASQLRPFAKSALVRLRDLLRISEESQKRRLGRAFLNVMGARPEENVDNMAVLTLGLVEIIKTEEVPLQLGAMRKLHKLDPDWEWTPPSAREEILNPLIRAHFELLGSLSQQDEMQRMELRRYLDLLDKDWEHSEFARKYFAQKLGAVLAPKPSIGDLLGASLGKIFQEVQQHFVEGLSQVTPAVRNPLDLKDSPAPSSNITWDNSQELREATELTSKAPTRRAGIEKLRTLCESSPTSSAPYALLAQALRYDDQYDQAESLLVEALPRVHSRSEIFDALGNTSSAKHDYLKATGYYLTAAYVMNPCSTDWGTLVYLSGVYRACGNDERARECQEAAAAMRGGNPVELRLEKFAAIREAIDSHKILVDLANNAWPSICDNIGRLSGKYGKETWKPGSPPAPAATVTAQVRMESAAMLDDFKGTLDELLRSAAGRNLPQLSSLNLETASLQEKMTAAALLAQSDSQFRNRFMALLQTMQSRAGAISAQLEKEPDSKPAAPASSHKNVEPSTLSSPEDPLGSIQKHADALASLLAKGAGPDHYERIKRIVNEIREFESRGFGDWERGKITECLRPETESVPAGVAYIGYGPPRKETPQWLVYSLLNGAGLDPTEFISAIARRHRSTLRWWLDHYANDAEQPENLREFAKGYILPACAYCGALRVTGALCPRCGKAMN